MNKQLQELTDITLQEIRNLEIVLPEIYRDIFYSKAKEMEIELSDIDKEAALLYALKKIQLIHDETEHSTNVLKENVINARIAITNKDNSSLEAIESNIKELESKITSLKEELYKDDLTRLYNRRWLFETYLLEDHFKKSASITDRLLTNTKQCLDWGVNRKLIGNNPIRHITGKRDLNIKKNKVDRILEDDEVALIWKICDESRMALKNALFIKICLFYANRYSELRMAKKSDFDFERKVWTVPPENHKTGKYTKRPLLRPILPEIEPFIQQAMELNDSIYMFVNNGTREMYGQNGPGKLPYNVMQYARRHYGIEMKHWSMHDLRRTARTHFSRFTSRDIAELMIGHTMPGEQGTYDYHDY